MNKISINLSPQKESASSETLQNLTFYIPLVGLGAVILLVLILLLQVVILKKTNTHKKYTKKWEEWEPKSKVIRGIKSELTNLENEKAKQTDVFAPKHETALILEDIFSSLSKNIWFESLYFKDGIINLRGYVVKWQEDYLISLEKFITYLGEKDYFSSKFSKVSMKSSKKTDFNGVRVLKFVIECRN